MLFNAPQATSQTFKPFPAVPQAARILPPPNAHSNEEDYDAAYLDARADSKVDQEADLPLFSPITETSSIVTSSELLDRCSQYLSKADVDRIRMAFQYADEAHLGQYRKSGEPYITHPLGISTPPRSARASCTTCSRIRRSPRSKWPSASVPR